MCNKSNARPHVLIFILMDFIVFGMPRSFDEIERYWEKRERKRDRKSHIKKNVYRRERKKY